MLLGFFTVPSWENGNAKQHKLNEWLGTLQLPCNSYIHMQFFKKHMVSGKKLDAFYTGTGCTVELNTSP